jgi:hypothetical protein
MIFEMVQGEKKETLSSMGWRRTKEEELLINY